METAVFNVKGQESGKIDLPNVFETKVSPALLHEIVVGYLANQRAGTHNTKTRGEVSGGGRKPWKEKGTGIARSGSNRSPLWRKGGIIFGPRPHGYYQNIPQQKRQRALSMALAQKAKQGNLLVVDTLTVDAPKTKKVAEIITNLKLQDSTVLLVVDKVDSNLKTASRNIHGIVCAEPKDLNAYQVLWANKVVFTSAALEIVRARQ